MNVTKRVFSLALVCSALVIASAFVIGYCSNMPSEPKAAHSEKSEAEVSLSKDAFLRWLPNFSHFDLQSVEFAMNRTEGRGSVPSPSDKKASIVARVTFKESSWETILDAHKWTEVTSDQIAQSIRVHVPDNISYKVSASFNATFSSNPYFAHGYVVVLVDTKEPVMFLIANNLNWPIVE